jgi:hypothetical protein
MPGWLTWTLIGLAVWSIASVLVGLGLAQWLGRLAALDDGDLDAVRPLTRALADELEPVPPNRGVWASRRGSARAH